MVLLARRLVGASSFTRCCASGYLFDRGRTIIFARRALKCFEQTTSATHRCRPHRFSHTRGTGFVNLVHIDHARYTVLHSLTPVHRRLSCHISGCHFLAPVLCGTVFVESSFCTSQGDETVTHTDRILTLPNLLTGARIAMSPVLGWLVLTGQYHVALVVFGLAGATDALDGFLARRLPGQASVLGSTLDPLADKILIGTLAGTLTYTGLLPWPVLALILSRDMALVVAVFGIKLWHLEKPRTFQRFVGQSLNVTQLRPTFLGKANIPIQFCVLLCALVSPIQGWVGSDFMCALFCLSAASSIFSGLSYLAQGGTIKLK